MSSRARLTEPSGTERLQKDYARWKRRPFLANLEHALRRDRVAPRMRCALLTMVRRAEADLIVRQATSPRGERWAFSCLWRSGLFAEAQRLLDGSPGLRRAAGLDRPPDPTGRSPVYDHDPYHQFWLARRAAPFWLLGGSGAVRRLRNHLLDAAAATRTSYDTIGPVVNVFIGGPPSREKDLAAKLLHRLSGRQPLRCLGPDDEDTEAALAEVSAHGTLYLKSCDVLRPAPRASLYAALTTRSHRGVPLDTLTIVDAPGASRTGHGDQHDPPAAAGPDGTFSGVLGRTIPGHRYYLALPDLRRRLTDVPAIVNQALQYWGIEELAPVRHHLACALWAEAQASGHSLNLDWLLDALGQLCHALSPGRARASSVPSVGTEDVELGTCRYELVETRPGQWALNWQGTSARIASGRKGMRAIAHLLDVGIPSGGAGEVLAAMDPASANRRGPLVSRQRVLDDDALKAYRARIAEIGRELVELHSDTAQSDDASELDRAGRRETTLISERDAIAAELRRSSGLGSLHRSFGGQSGGGKSAAAAVGNELKRALDKLSAHAQETAVRSERQALEEFHAHLTQAIKGRSSHSVRYEPQPTVQWRVSVQPVAARAATARRRRAPNGQATPRAQVRDTDDQ